MVCSIVQKGFFSNLLNFSCLCLKGFLYVVRTHVMYHSDLSAFYLVSRDSRKPTQFNATRLASFNSFVFCETKPRKLLNVIFKETFRVVHFSADWKDQCR